MKEIVEPGADVVMCGVATDCCVLATALAAMDDGARVRLVADACAAGSDDVRKSALAIMATHSPHLVVVTAKVSPTT